MKLTRLKRLRPILRNDSMRVHEADDPLAVEAPIPRFGEKGGEPAREGPYAHFNVPVKQGRVRVLLVPRRDVAKCRLDFRQESGAFHDRMIAR